MSEINIEAYEVYKRVEIMILKWRQENSGRLPKYLFLSKDAYDLLNDFGIDGKVKATHFMDVEIAPVVVPGIYAAIGEEF